MTAAVEAASVPARKAPVDRVERWPVARLIPYARNARTHTDAQVDQIAGSMKEFGQAQLIVVDEEGLIIAGHGRVLAAQKLGWTELMVGIAVGWSEPQKRAYRIADNQIGLTSGWDEQLLKLELAELRLGKFDLPILGFEMLDLNGRQIVRGVESASDFLDDMTNAEVIDESAQMVATPRGIALRLEMLPDERDIVIEFLAKERDHRGLRTTAEALIALARDGLKKSRKGK